MMRGGPGGPGGFGGHGRGFDARDVKITEKSWQALRRFGPYIKPYASWMALAVALMIAASLTSLAGPFLVGRAIDVYIAGKDLTGLTGVALLYAVLYLVNWATSYGQTYIMSYAGQNIIASLRQDLFDHLQGLGFNFYDKWQTGAIMSRVTSDVDQLSNLVSSGLVMMITDVATLIGIVFLMVYLNWRLALVTLVSIPLMGSTVALFQGRLRSRTQNIRARIAQVNANLEQSISGIRVTQAFAREDVNAREFTGVNEENLQANLSAAVLFSMLLPVIQIISALGTFLVLWYGGTRIHAAQMTLGALVSFLSYVSRFFHPIQDIGRVYSQVVMAMVSLERIFGLMDQKGDIVDHPSAAEPPRFKGHIRFEDVTFSYEPGKPVLRNVAIEVLPGQMVALVGPTGAGKTSAISLLSRFYDPDSGRIDIDGRDIKEYRIRSLRRQVGVVLQDVFVFSGTVKGNIAYGDKDMSDEQIVSAARTVNADRFIRQLPGGYDAEIREHGSGLSVGQRQLLGFARAVATNPSILILDEATSNIDAYTEVLIQEAMDKMLSGRTSIVIAHRLSTIRNADMIYVIDDGRVIEQGSHKELMEQGGLYKHLYETQFREE
jgi:ATP-binding cassette subfamily B protein